MSRLEIFRKPSIAKKILMSFLMISLVPVVFVGYITYKTSEKEIKKETLKNLLAIAESKDDSFNEYIKGKEREARELAFTPNVINVSEKYHAAFHNGGVDSKEYISLEREQSKYFADFVNEFGYHDLFLVDADGDVFFSVKREDDFGTNLYNGPYKDTGLAEIFTRTMSLKKTGISDFRYYAPSNKPAAFIGAPVFKEREMIGSVILQLSNEEIYREVQNYIGLGRTGEIVIASREGNEAVFIAPLRHDPEAAFNRKVIIGSNEALPIQRAVQEESGSGLSVDYRNKEILAVWRYLPHLRWGMVVKMDTEEAYKHIYALRNYANFIGLITIIVVTLTALRISKSISDPIRALQKGSKIIGDGNLDYIVGTDAKDEIGDLSRSFAEMSGNLKKSHMKLEDEITERRKAEEKINKSLRDKEVLLQEIHHRVKNNMEVVSSLLKLQAGHIKDEKYRDILNVSMSRIKTMSLIHEKLYRSADLSKVDFSAYVRDMAADIFKAYEMSPGKITLKMDIEDVSLGINDAIPCGLILNELVSNALKYGFPEGREGEVRVGLRINDKDDVELTISDNGVGMTENLDHGNIDSLGLKLVNTLVRQLQGKVELHREKGTGFQITFRRRA